jgi:hypothetical protein
MASVKIVNVAYLNKMKNFLATQLPDVLSLSSQGGL